MAMKFDTQRFNQAVYEIVSQIPRGKVLSYGDVAKLAGWSNYSRHVGHALRNCPAAEGIPCHRVVNSQGAPAPRFTEQRARLLAEGVTFKANGNVDMQACAWKFREMDIDEWEG